MHSLYIYGAIGDAWFVEDSITAAEFTKQLNACGDDEVCVYVNSPGGDVFDGITIYSALERYPGKVHVVIDGLAASAASYCIMAADDIAISPSAMVMIHNAWTSATGNARELHEQARVLEKLDETICAIYAKKSGKSLEEIAQLMEGETWFSAQEAIDAGLVDAFAQERKIAACISPDIFSHYKNLPDELTCNAHEKVETPKQEESVSGACAARDCFISIAGKVYPLRSTTCE